MLSNHKLNEVNPRANESGKSQGARDAALSPFANSEASSSDDLAWEQSVFDIERRIVNGSLSATERKEEIANWCSSIANHYGLDDNSEDYREKLTPHITRVLSLTAPADGSRIVDSLSHYICSGPTLAFLIEQRAKDAITPSGATRMFLEGRCSILQELPNTNAVITFLGQPLACDISSLRLGELHGGRAAQFHKEFWAQDKCARDTFIGKLFTVDLPRIHVLLSHQAALQQLLTSFLPPARPNATDEHPGAQRIGLLVGRKFAELATPADLASGISAILTSNFLDAVNPPSTDPEVCFGWRLAIFLRELGPGTNKAGQYGDSLWTTPEAWLEGLRSTKFEGSALSRAETWRYLEKILPPTLYCAISLGRPVGYGSYLANYDISLDPAYRARCLEYKDLAANVELVLSIVKPNGREDASRMINLLLDILSEVEKSSSAAQRTVAPLRSIIEQGKRMIIDETDLNVSKIQETLFQQFIDSVSISTDGVLYEQYTAGAFEVGELYRTSRKVHGPHVNDWIRKTGVGDTETLAADIVNIFVGEIHAWLTGRPVCHDRHLDNVARTTSRIGHFDPGARAKEAPTPHMLRSICNLMVDALLNSRRNHYSFGSSFKYVLSLAEERHRRGLEDIDTSYCFETQRMLISWGDLIRATDKRNYPFMALAVARTGKIAEPILSTFFIRSLSYLGLLSADFIKKKTPFLLPVLRGVATMPGLRSPAHKIRNEASRREIYYPHNPNPNKRIRMPSDSKNSVNSMVPFTPPRIVITDTGVPSSSLGRCLSVVARTVEFFVRRRYLK